ncbi:helix-turn-helix domain-containing protein [Devosia sp.]|uniref:helix-turn-helix domain-containing protein n=1 Tax=Devosia sp. TaxID=1871048 RepID=UPI0032631C51
MPNQLRVSHQQPGIMLTPHWHAQVEINYLFRGTMDYRMHGHSVRLKAGELCIFWGGLPHQSVDTSDDAFYVAMHIPLIHFFRLRLPPEVTGKLIHGATLVTTAPDGSDDDNFNRWSDYMRNGGPAKADHAIDELLLRIERVQFEPFYLIEPGGMTAGAVDHVDNQSFSNISNICDYIATNFRHDIDSIDIASSVDIHPKYAMSVFKKSTGMTLNEYVNLLRLSYAQALLMQDDVNVLQVAMESGFGSLSAFNKAFRKIAGMSPSDFRRDSRFRPSAASLRRPEQAEELG